MLRKLHDMKKALRFFKKEKKPKPWVYKGIVKGGGQAGHAAEKKPGGPRGRAGAKGIVKGGKAGHAAENKPKPWVYKGTVEGGKAGHAAENKPRPWVYKGTVQGGGAGHAAEKQT